MMRTEHRNRVSRAARSIRHPAMMPGKSRQRGLSAWGYLGLLLLVGAAVTLGLRIGPHYLTHQTMVGVMEGIGRENVHKMDKRSIRELLTKRFQINSLYELDPRKIVEIERTKERTTLVLDYEVREPIVYNVDAVMRFHEEYQFQ